MKTRYLICYDITRPRRLQRIHKFLKARGFHIQYSVFLLHLGWQQLQQVKEEISGLINPKYDDVRIYPLPSACKEIILGIGNRLPKDIQFFM